MSNLYKHDTFRCIDCGAGTDFEHKVCGFCGGQYVHKSDYFLRHKTFDNPPARATAHTAKDGTRP